MRHIAQSLAVVLALTFAALAPARADLLEDGRRAIEIGDQQKAIQLLSRAAARGNPKAQTLLGRLYWQEGNRAAAVALFHTAAEQRDAAAQYFLGIAYARGTGVEQDGEEAVKYLELAAEQGVVRARRKLGEFYDFGIGIKRDLVRAYMWLELAEGFGDSEWQQDFIARRMTEEEIAEAKRLAREWKPKWRPLRDSD